MQIYLTNTVTIHQLAMSTNSSHGMFVQEIHRCESECAYADHVQAHVKINARYISIKVSIS